MENKRILFVLNEKSGTSDAGNIRETISSAMENAGIEHEVFTVSGENVKDTLKKKILSVKPSVVAAVGGDGTINLVASVIKGMPVRLGIIPQGSANGLAYELGIPEKPQDAINLMLKGKSKPMDVVRVNNDNISLHLSDVGINARIVSAFEKDGTRGLKGYLKYFLKEISGDVESFRCRIRIKDKIYSHRSIMTIIANSGSYRTGASINPDGKTDDGRFEVVVIQPHKRWLLRSFFGAFTGTFHKQPHIKTYSCTAAVITIDPEQELQVDGESLGKTSEITAAIEKHALNVIM